MKFSKTTWFRRGLMVSPILVVLAVAGCGALSTFYSVANQHPVGWDMAHGKIIQEKGVKVASVDNGMTCNLCHTTEKGTDGKAAPSRGATSTCFSCHSGYLTDNPHSDDWKHGEYLKQNGGVQAAKVDGKSCSACHTTAKDAEGHVPVSPRGPQVASCFGCHDGTDGPSWK